MKFFKAFNLLHRRTKSATFVPGSTGLPEFAPAANVKSFSYSPGVDHPPGSVFSLFDFITSNPRPFPQTYNPNAEDDQAPDRVLGLWRSRRHSDKSTLSGFQSSVKKECFHLTEAVDFWISEYTKLQKLLKDCHAELLMERLKTGNLEARANTDREEIESLRTSLSHLERFHNKSKRVGHSDPPPGLDARTNTSTNSRRPSPETETSIIITRPKIPYTFDQYSAALQMILNARRELRDQRKVSKYWKAQAVLRGQQVTITPSVSSISSIQELLPPDRQLAVEGLMSERGISIKLTRLYTGHSASSSKSSLRITSQASDEDKCKSMLPYTNSKSSEISRLGPLASESLKQEIHLLFGPVSPSKKKVAFHNRQKGSLEMSKSSSVKTGLSTGSKNSRSIESFGEITTILQKAFGVRPSPAKHESKQMEVCRETDSLNSEIQLSVLVAKNMIETSVSSSLLESSIPSGCSQTWVNLETIEPDFVIPDMTFLTEESGVKKATKERTPRRSWQTYVGRPPSTKGVSREHPPEKRHSPLKGMLSKISTVEKENDATSIGHAGSKKKHSRLPVPALGKKEP